MLHSSSIPQGLNLFNNVRWEGKLKVNFIKMIKSNLRENVKLYNQGCAKSFQGMFSKSEGIFINYPKPDIFIGYSRKE